MQRCGKVGLVGEIICTVILQLISVVDQINNHLDARNKRIEIELAFIESLTEEAVEEMYVKTCLKYEDVNGMSFKKWYEQSLKYYTIDSNHVVHSRARSPKTVDSVPCNNLAHAKYRILTLIKTKFNDHAVRGYDFAWEINDESTDTP